MRVSIATVALLLFAHGGFAQSYRAPAKTETRERAAMLEGLARGKDLMGSRDRYRQLPQVSAIALANPSETPAQAVARAGDQGAPVLETKGRLVLYRSAQTRPASIGSSGKASVYPTVLNTRTGTLGVLTGTLIVKPKNMSDADAIAASYGLAKSKAYPQLQAVFYSAKAGVDIADVSAALRADPRVESAYPEIVERVRVPK
jgi:Open reading frame 2 N-terminal domain